MRILYFTPAPTALPDTGALAGQIGQSDLYPDLSLVDARDHYDFTSWQDLSAYQRHHDDEFDALLVSVPQKSSASWKDFINGMVSYSARSDAKPIVAMYAPPAGAQQSCTEMYDVMAAGATYAYDTRTDIKLLTEYLARAATTPPKSRVKPFEVGPLRIDFQTRIVTLHEKSLSLSSQQFDLLSLLSRRAGRVLSKDVLMNGLYQTPSGDDEPDEKIIDVVVCKLRKTLISTEIDRLGDRMIRTVWGQGYRMAANTDELAQPLTRSTKDNDIAHGTVVTMDQATFIKGAYSGEWWFSDLGKRLTRAEGRLLQLTFGDAQAQRAHVHGDYIESGIANTKMRPQNEALINRAVERTIRTLNKKLDSAAPEYEALHVHYTRAGTGLYFWCGDRLAGLRTVPGVTMPASNQDVPRARVG